MASVPCFKRRFTPDWRMSLLALITFLLLLSLGFWQLARADEKKQMLAAQLSLAKDAPLRWAEGMALPKQYQPLTIKGHYLPEVFLLDNQHYQHQFGYHLLSPFLINSGKIILLDRGWVAGDIRRQIFPESVIPPGLIELRGDVYYPSEKNWVLGQVLEKKSEKLALIERIEPKLIGQFLHKSVYPFIMRLNKDEVAGYVREWAVVAMPPERHYAYALQWFAMALVILILFIALNLKKTYESI